MTTDTNKRFILPLEKVIEGERIRKDYGDITDLAKSLETYGLMQPIVVHTDGRLVAGGRRLRAARQLKWTTIPVTYFEFADEATLRMLELEENVRRKSMTWQERVLSVAAVHKQQQLTKILNGEKWTQSATGELLGRSAADVSYALQLADYINRGDKEILACERMWDAIHLLVKRAAEESNKILAKATVPAMDPALAKKLLEESLSDETPIFASPTGPQVGGVQALADDGEMPSAPADEPETLIPISRVCIHADSIAFVQQLPDASVDHCITDWPYAIDMDMLQQENTGIDVSATAAQHDVDENETLHRVILPQLFRVLKPGGFFITWTDPMQWQRNYDLAVAAGFKVQRWPLIWHKTHRCMNQMASYNFTKNYEIAIVCRKEKATLVVPQGGSVFAGATDEATRALGHPFAKPAALWQWLYAACTIRGQTVLDPFAGCGSSTLAAVQYGLQPLAVEKVEKHHSQMVVNVSEHYRKTFKKVRFV